MPARDSGDTFLMQKKKVLAEMDIAAQYTADVTRYNHAEWVAWYTILRGVAEDFRLDDGDTWLPVPFPPSQEMMK